MTSPGPKSPGPDAKPPEPVHESESRSKINGHPPSDELEPEPKTKSTEETPTKKPSSEGEPAPSPKGDEPSEKLANKATDEQVDKATDKAAEEQADKATEKPVATSEKTAEKSAEKAVDKPDENATESPADTLDEKPTEKPVDKAVDKPAVTPSDKESADKPLDEKSTSVDDTAAEAGATDTDKPKDENLKPEATSTPAVEADEAKSSADRNETTEAVEANEPGSRSPNAKESVPKPSEKSPDAAAEDDVPMTDSPPEKAGQDTTAPVADEKTAAPTCTSGKDAEQDTVMTDIPSEEAGQPPKPSVSNDTTPAVGKAPDTEVDLGSAGLSQLAIGSAEKEPSPVPPTTDTLMTDAPSAKVARERDEDNAEEPAPKRARTEPTEDETTVKAPADASVDAAEEPAAAAAAPATVEAPILDELFPTRLVKWTDETVNASLISSFQRQEIRKLLTKLRKNKLGSPFKDSVEKMWPDLWNSYQLKIDRPMDLGQLERSLRVGRDDSGNSMQSFADFKANLALIFENSLAYNGATHHVTEASANVVRTVWEEAMRLPAEEPARPKPPPKAKPARESRAAASSAAASVEAAAHRQSAGPTASPAGGDATATKPADAALPKPTPAAPTEAAPQPQSAPPVAAGKWQPGGSGGGGHRRSLTAADVDRPKRKVRAPKPKDIDYTTKPSRKKMKPELQFCDEVLTELMHSRNHRQNSWFMEPVDAQGLNIPTYYSTIKKPMDLGKVRRMLSGGEITNAKDFDKNVRLIFDNCYKFNGPPSEKHPVSALARELEELYTEQMERKEEWLSKHAAKAHAAAASVSNASDDDDGDDDDDDDGGDAVGDSVEIEELRAKLDEETRKLNELILGGNQSLIKIHKGIVDVVQNALMEAVQKAREAKTKRSKSKKSAKGGKVKAPGGRKSGGGSSQAKKSGGSKKAATKRNLTAAEMDQVANAINDLEHPHLQRAIDIIKKDTGQNENTDGELELDIDQLSNDAMFKLWDLCKKALPAFGKDSTVAPDESAEVNRGATAKQAPKTAATKRKNKPMSAQEQDARIAQLKEVSKLYRPPGQEPAEVAKVTQAPTPMGDSSEDSDSEEE
ncbi:hypothetical protein CP533_2514 [Ophiocordyceps camponoti-saundersi (nom. inval.)]|nr:hypothetical protein CP533_2514 [Ophiocordyceps camponoti-saundersi (nom. inval.)]